VLAEPGPPPEPERRRSPWPWIALLVALLLAGGGVAAYLLTRPVKKVVPHVTGEQLNTARTTLQNDGFAVSVIDVTNSNPTGTVIAQDPQGATKADEGSTVSLTVSQGPGNTTVPSVEGLPLEQAKRMITQAGLKVGRVQPFSSNQFPAGAVTDTQPNAGQSVLVGTTVTIFVSSGKPQIAVPDVMGEPEADARAQLETDGFKVVTSTQTSSTVTAGNVISQDPPGNSQATQGSTVALVIATAPPTTTVPDVTGQTAGAAVGILSGAGFKVAQQTTNVNQQSQDGQVVSQNPSAGTTVNKGSTVTITVGKFTPPPTTSTSTTTTHPRTTPKPTHTTTTSTTTTTTTTR
jgi:serine/threonine-protein kinase